MEYKKELEKLNEYQREAVLDESNVCIVNANVGSGKTTVLISKVIYLHYAKNISYKDMLVLTFTNKAADEIKDRLLSLDGSIQKDELQGFGTFHSVALHLLKNKLPIEKIGYTRDFLVIEPEEELDIAMGIIQEEKLQIKYKNRLKKRLEQAMTAEGEAQPASKYKDDLFKLVQLLKEEKIKQNKMSFTDLLQNAKALVEEYKLEPAWIIIDEVQDSDKLQIAFIDVLKGANTKLFAVGDPNQVIYSWRGSALNVVYSLKHKYAAKELSLPINYRSSGIILEAARCFQQNGDSLTGIREVGNKIIVKNHYNPFSEACYLIDKIQELHNTGVSYHEIAIFYRLQEQSQVFEDVFLKNGLPFEVSLKKTVGDIEVLNWVIKLLRFSINPKDWASGVYVLSHKDYGERVKEAEARKMLRGEKNNKSKLLTKMQAFLNECSDSKGTEELYKYFQLDSYIRPTSAAFKEDKEAICTLLDRIMEYVKEKELPFLKGLAEFINSSALYGVNILKRDIKRNADSVKLMTLHASKGLEFSHVFITGVNYGLIPLQTKNEEEEEEEQRLFFVGITRAKEYLELSYYTNPEYRGAASGESRYIRMIPKRLLQNDEVQSSTVNLQELKRQIQQAKNEGKKQALLEAIKQNSVLGGAAKDETAEQKTILEITEMQGTSKQAFEEQPPIKQVKHKKYGKGKVLREDETMIEVEFEKYGVKEFMKAFSELEGL